MMPFFGNGPRENNSRNDAHSAQRKWDDTRAAARDDHENARVDELDAEQVPGDGTPVHALQDGNLLVIAEDRNVSDGWINAEIEDTVEVEQ